MFERQHTLFHITFNTYKNKKNIPENITELNLIIIAKEYAQKRETQKAYALKSDQMERTDGCHQIRNGKLLK